MRCSWLLLVTLAACHVTPPLRISAGAGAQGTITRAGSRGGGLADLGVGISPVGAQGSSLGRGGDFTVGWMASAQFTRGGQVAHGPYLEIDWFVRRASPYHGGWRVGPTFRLAAMPTHTAQGYGKGDTLTAASLGLRLEQVSSEDSHLARGEYGLGFGLHAGLRAIDDETYGSLMLSLDLRFPSVRYR